MLRGTLALTLVSISMSAKLFLFYLRFRKPIIFISGAIALILVSLNTWFEYQAKTANYSNWQVVEVESGDRFRVSRDNQTKTVNLCGVTSGAREYLRSVIDKGDGTVFLEKTGDAYEAWVMIAGSEYQIHLNTWMLEKGMAKLGSNFTQCRSDEELEFARAIAQKGKLGIWKTR